jgi:hypothetical protein
MPCMQVSKAKVWVEQAPWKRVQIGGISHQHGGCAASDASLELGHAARQGISPTVHYLQLVCTAQLTTASPWIFCQQRCHLLAAVNQPCQEAVTQRSQQGRDTHASQEVAH